MTQKNPKTLESFDTELSADSVEWCPINPFKNIFVCGTYQLSTDEMSKESRAGESSKRLGRIYLFQVIENKQLSLLQKLDVPAVLDMKWRHGTTHGKVLLGVVNSIGHIELYELSDESNPCLTLFTKKNITEGRDNVLALSLDWRFGKYEYDDHDINIVVSDSTGSITILRLINYDLEVERVWNAHEFEAWIAAFDYWNPHLVYTGGDDCKFQWFDWRMNTKVGVNKKHSAGVTSLHSNANREFLLASGSYDEVLRLWDTRRLQDPISEINLNGGIWRLKWDPIVHKYLLAACMYGGFRIIDCDEAKEPSIVAEYMDHESIAYGCDWSHMKKSEINIEKKVLDETEQNLTLIGTCSFYDHTLKLSCLHLEKI